MAVYYLNHSSELYHYGILGMHWGIRRFQPYPKGYKGGGKFVGSVKNALKKVHMPGNHKGITMREAKQKRLQTFGSEIVDKVLADKYGDRGTTRIARRVMNGDTIEKAIRKEKVRKAVTNALSIASTIALSHFVISPAMQIMARAVVSEFGGVALSKAMPIMYRLMGIDNPPAIVANATQKASLDAMKQMTNLLTPNAKRGANMIATVERLLGGNGDVGRYYRQFLNGT